MMNIYKDNESPVYWDDGKNTHICDGGEMQDRIVLLWTLCQIDVPANQAFKQPNSQGDDHNLNIVTCEKCLKEQTK